MQKLSFNVQKTLHNILLIFQNRRADNVAFVEPFLQTSYFMRFPRLLLVERENNYLVLITKLTLSLGKYFCGAKF